jgi:hypothetical protein
MSWYASISPWWQRIVEARTIPAKLSFRSTESDMIRHFFRYEHRRFILQHLEYDMSAKLPQHGSAYEALSMGSLPEGILVPPLETRQHWTVLRVLSQLHALFTELSAWPRLPGTRLALSIRLPIFRVQEMEDSLVLDQLSLLILGFPALPFVHSFSLVAEDLPPRLVYCLLRAFPNLSSLALHFCMLQGPRQARNTDIGIQHCQG